MRRAVVCAVAPAPFTRACSGTDHPVGYQAPSPLGLNRVSTAHAPIGAIEVGAEASLQCRLPIRGSTPITLVDMPWISRLDCVQLRGFGASNNRNGLKSTYALQCFSTKPQTLPINSTHSDVTYQRDQVAFAKRAVLTAQVQVQEVNLAVLTAQVTEHKVKLIVACLESAIGKCRNLDDAEFRELAASADERINTEFVRVITTIKDFTLEKAKQELDKAKQELDKAEVKHEKAKQELDKAKQELDKAEVKLDKAEVKLQELGKYGLEGDVATVLEQCKALRLEAMDPACACDMSRIAKFMALETEAILRMKNIIGPNARSVVIRSASGVGKTFATIALTNALLDPDLNVGYFPIALYMGFNSHCPLSPEEEGRLKRNDEMSENRLKLVLLRRLLLQLSYLASADVLVNDSLWDRETGLQRMPMPPRQVQEDDVGRWSNCRLHFRTDTNCNVLVQMVCSLLDKISEKVGKPVVIYPIVDEGQYLDTHCPKSSGDPGHNQGARWALRLLRSIQIAVLNDHEDRGKQSARNTALGIMTGINPAVSLVNTDGKNISYSEPLHSMEGFKEITRGHQTSPKRTNGQIARIATTFYPIARDVANFSSNGKDEPFNFNRTGVDAAELIIASGMGKQVTRKWSTDTPAIFVEKQESSADGKETFTPVLGIRHVAAAATSLGALSCAPNLITDLALHIDFRGFEDACLFSLSMLLVLRNYMLKSEEVSFSGKNIHHSVLKWLLVGVPLKVLSVIKPENAKTVQFPSSSNDKSHAAAFSIVNGPPLDAAFDLTILGSVGDTVLVACGGNSPVDFIIVTLMRLKDASHSHPRAKLQIRLCDAKLVSSKEKSSISGISKMCERFEWVQGFLDYHLPIEYNYEVEFSPPAIITTSTDTKMPKGIIAISPATCHFSPITDWLFAWAPERQRSDDAPGV